MGRRRLAGGRPRAPRLLTVSIPARFNGPPGSAHGGYACAVVAGLIDAPAAAVSLRAPPPLERPLRVRCEGDTVALLDDETLIATGEPAELELDVPEPVSLGVAERASAASPWWEHHPFPTCFGCGPDRDPAKALRVIMGPVAGREVWAAPWTPAADLAGAHGRVTPRFTWAALDCPTAAAAVPAGSEPHVLARLTARPLAPPRAGEPHVVIAWPAGEEGRKRFGGAAIFDPRGELCGIAEGLWLELQS